MLPVYLIAQSLVHIIIEYFRSINYLKKPFCNSLKVFIFSSDEANSLLYCLHYIRVSPMSFDIANHNSNKGDSSASSVKLSNLSINSKSFETLLEPLYLGI